MARAEWKINHIPRGKISYMKRIILIFCSVNVVLALYFLHVLCTSLHIFSYGGGGSSYAVKYTPDQLMKMAESMRIRKDSEPLELIKLVNKLDKEFSNVENLELPAAVKQKIVDDILQMLRNVNSSDENAQRDAMEKWRKEKLEEASQLSAGNRLDNSTFLPEEAGILLRALGSNWASMLENIGVWMPSQIIHNVHDDAPEGADELDEDIIPGRPLPPECHAEKHTDYGGDAVRWGLTNPKDSAADCCQACLDQAKNARPGEKKCNIWVYCPLETGCHSPDIYEHKNQECWLKYAERPKVTFKDQYSEAYRNSHPTAPLIVPWVSGVIST